MSFTSCLYVMAGGALGTLARYAIAVAALPISRSMPWGTIAINVAGSFIIGFFGTLTLAHGRFPVSENARLFVMIGLCGGFTTFSSFSLQTLSLMNDGEWVGAGGNIVLSIVLCLIAVWAGQAIASNLNAFKWI
ncbi:MAG TPA: fluoride efflux transporter CrcB [Stellaceae bacterium]|nr:fluoride efflux transporter CrcB [Stellaceae bacterium]